MNVWNGVKNYCGADTADNRRSSVRLPTLLVLLVLAACYFSSCHATRVDPVQTLRLD
jgi:hypothetical protein